MAGKIHVWHDSTHSIPPSETISFIATCSAKCCTMEYWRCGSCGSLICNKCFNKLHRKKNYKIIFPSLSLVNSYICHPCNETSATVALKSQIESRIEEFTDIGLDDVSWILEQMACVQIDYDKEILIYEGMLVIH